MTTQTAKLVYVIQNGPLKNTIQSVDIQVELPSSDGVERGLDGLIEGAGVLGNAIALGLYIKSVRGSREAFAEVGHRLAALEMPDVVGPIGDVGEQEVAPVEVQFDELAVDLGGAEAAVEAGAIDAAAAASLVPAIGWAVSAGLFTVIAIANLAAYIHRNTAKGHLASVVFINAVPNTNLKITSASWDDSLEIQGGESAEAIMTEHAHSTMEEAGALAYTWRASGLGQAGGKLGIEMTYDMSSDSFAGDLEWWIHPGANPDHECTLKPTPTTQGGNLISVQCYKQPVVHGDQNHYVLLYTIFPTPEGARRVARTIDPSRPLVWDSMWSTTTGYYSIGLYGDGPGYAEGQGAFRTGDVASILRDLTLGYAFGTGNPEVQIRLCSDDGGKPGAAIESWTTVASAAAPLVVVSRAHPRLEPNSLYWVTADPDRQSTHWWEGCDWVERPKGAENRGTVRLRVCSDPV
ncbi:hypothetical protein [Reyranella sp.]|uniref:hypothetical protein n=1 Tax=Reyranella sp. TaxID=1929291 RepID=UPI003BAB6A23